ncbi:MAG: DUF554 domain-containing protein [Intestinibacter sp.]|uniref:DUF554 domain-containing protein n=1 Tax=Intestinibacter sp. TaxID=1965304 RepID=UPI002A821CED|nr:DUF554 domain-containing protein [Intestinibacter sp.]MDY4575140.1 DUF554 domain-containing protein [Intestinibacter sp.]
MFGLGVIVNSLAVVIASLAALLLKNFIQRLIKKETIENISNTVMAGLALCVIYMGMSGALECKHPIVCIVSMVVGGIIGEALNIDRALNKFGEKLEAKFNKNNNEQVTIAQGFVSASLLFCVGAMAVVGSLNSGLFGDNNILYAKSALDGIVSFLFALTMGIGVLLAAAAVFVYEGAIALCSFLLKGLLATSVITEMNAVGSLLIMALGINIILKSDIKVANLLPAMFIPIIFGVFGVI